MSSKESFKAQDGYSSTDESSSHRDSSTSKNNSSVSLKLKEHKKKPKNVSDMEEIFENLPDTYPYKPNPEDPSLKFNNVRQAELSREAPFLYFEKPKHLVERASGFMEFVSHNYDHLVITEINVSKDTMLKKLELSQQTFMNFGIPYSDWTKACLVCFRGEAARKLMGTPGFNYQMPWGRLLKQLLQGVSVIKDFDLKTFISKENYKEGDLVAPLLKQKVTMIKEAPSTCDKHEALLLLKAFVHMHIAPVNKPDFVPSVANFEKIENEISKRGFYFCVTGKDGKGFDYTDRVGYR